MGKEICTVLKYTEADKCCTGSLGCFTRNGGITRLVRYGLKADGTYGKVDDLHITYDDNRIATVRDDADAVTQAGSMDYPGGASAMAFEYDSSGSLIKDESRDIKSVEYMKKHILTTIVVLSSTLMTTLLGFSANPQFYPLNNDSVISLRKLELEKCTTLYNIVADVASEVADNNSDNKMYLVSITNNNSGNNVNITEYIGKELWKSNNYIGFYILNDRLFIFKQSEGNYTIPYSKDNDSLTFKILNSFDFPGYRDPMEWHYYIHNDCYARGIIGINWFWYLPPDYNLKKENLFVTAPKRTLK